MPEPARDIDDWVRRYAPKTIEHEPAVRAKANPLLIPDGTGKRH
jgi:hypothetical protein